MPRKKGPKDWDDWYCERCDVGYADTDLDEMTENENGEAVPECPECNQPLESSA